MGNEHSSIISDDELFDDSPPPSSTSTPSTSRRRISHVDLPGLVTVNKKVDPEELYKNEPEIIRLHELKRFRPLIRSSSRPSSRSKSNSPFPYPSSSENSVHAYGVESLSNLLKTWQAKVFKVTQKLAKNEDNINRRIINITRNLVETEKKLLGDITQMDKWGRDLNSIDKIQNNVAEIHQTLFHVFELIEKINIAQSHVETMFDQSNNAKEAKYLTKTTVTISPEKYPMIWSLMEHRKATGNAFRRPAPSDLLDLPKSRKKPPVFRQTSSVSLSLQPVLSHKHISDDDGEDADEDNSNITEEEKSSLSNASASVSISPTSPELQTKLKQIASGYQHNLHRKLSDASD